MQYNRGTPYEERVGKKFNKLTISKLTGHRQVGNKIKTTCLVLCDCGVEKEMFVENVVASKDPTKSCGCAKRIRGNSALARTYGRYKSGAKKRGYTFDLSRDEFQHLLTQTCHYCGCEPSTLASYNGQDFVYNGIDRKDNVIGYTLENSLTCCITCNRAKNDMSYDEFVSWIRRLKSHDI